MQWISTLHLECWFWLFLWAQSIRIAFSMKDPCNTALELRSQCVLTFDWMIYRSRPPCFPLFVTSLPPGTSQCCDVEDTRTHKIRVFWGRERWIVSFCVRLFSKNEHSAIVFSPSCHALTFCLRYAFGNDMRESKMKT